jgi:hypothetical protein
VARRPVGASCKVRAMTLTLVIAVAVLAALVFGIIRNLYL